MSKTIVFCDTNNKEIDEEYAEKLIKGFRLQTKWLVEKDSKIWHDLRKFSIGYSKEKRDVSEVAVIFQIAHGLSII